jgi:hypothetical protein
MAALGFAHLEEPILEDLRRLEKKHDIILLAYEKPPEFASLTHEQILQLEALERKMGFRLVAYR